MAKGSRIALGLAAFFFTAPVTAEAGWDLELYKPHLYPAPPFHFSAFDHYPSAYYYPPFYNARTGYVAETRRVRVEKRRAVRSRAGR